jgi:hypothetical protein
MQRKEVNETHDITSLAGGDIWRVILKLLSPQECVILTFVSKDLKEILKKIINSPLYALFIVPCCFCGSTKHDLVTTQGYSCIGQNAFRSQSIYPVRRIGPHTFTIEFRVITQMEYRHLNTKGDAPLIMHVKEDESVCVDLSSQVSANFFMVYPSPSLQPRPRHEAPFSFSLGGGGNTRQVFMQSGIKAVYLFWENDYKSVLQKNELAKKVLNESILY